MRVTAANKEHTCSEQHSFLDNSFLGKSLERMRIAYDARPLCPPKTGTGRYLQGLLQELIPQKEVQQAFLCSCRPIELDSPLLLDPKVTLLIRSGWKGPLWLETVVPIELVRRKVDLFHGSLFLSPLVCPCPTIITIYDLSYLMVPGQLEAKNRLILKLLLPWSIRHASRIIALSEFTKREILSQWSLPPEKVVVIPGAASPQFIRALDSCNVRAVLDRYKISNPYILCVGTLEPRKNLPAAIEAFRKVQRSGMSSYSLVLAGRPGWKLRGIYNVIEKSPYKEKIRLLGYVPEYDLPALYRGADLVLYLSLYEGFGFPPVEAMACGSVVLASNRASIPECVGDAGVLVDPSDIDEIAENMIRLLNDKDLRQELGKRAIVRAKHFSWERSASTLMALYQDVVECRNVA